MHSMPAWVKPDCIHWKGLVVRLVVPKQFLQIGSSRGCIDLNASDRHPIVELPHLGRAEETPLLVLFFLVSLHLVGPSFARHEDEVFSNRSARELGSADANPDYRHEVRKLILRCAACDFKKCLSLLSVVGFGTERIRCPQLQQDVSNVRLERGQEGARRIHISGADIDLTAGAFSADKA